MNKIEVTGNVTQITKNTYPSGCCLAIVKIITKLFDGTTQNLSVNFFNSFLKSTSSQGQALCLLKLRFSSLSKSNPK